MAWKPNKRFVAEGFRDLQYLPRARFDWDFTLASLAFGTRRVLGRGRADLGAWAARHGLPASRRLAAIGPDALVLWHGTSRARADKIAEHGLFHKRGLWTTLDPWISHSYCRGRSDRFATEGAVVCLVLDPAEVEEGRHYDVEDKGDILRFRQGLPPEVVEYVFTGDGIRFTGPERARRPAPWPAARFKRQGGRWTPVQQAPVRYDEEHGYASLEEFARLTLGRLLEELGSVAAIEIFSTVYALIEPPGALAHDEVLGLIEEVCAAGPVRGKWRTFRPCGEAGQPRQAR